MNQADRNSGHIARELGQLRFLVVDDFENFRTSMKQMLRGLGVQKVETVGSANAAIQTCTYESFDVILCDYNLGKGKNGQHILEELRYRGLLKRTALFIMVTAETSRDMVMGARENQPDGYLTKPINRSVLDQRLTKLLQQRSALLPINREIDLENYPKAITLCNQLLKSNSRYKTWLLKTLADLYIRVGDSHQARLICSDALKQRDLPWARMGLARALVAERYLDEAIDTLQPLIENQPDYVEAYDLLAEARRLKGDLPGAQAILEQATERSPNAILRFRNLGEIAAGNQDLEVAAEAWEKTVSLGAHSIHDSADHYLALGDTLGELSSGDTSEVGRERAAKAVDLLGKVGKRFPDHPTATQRARIIESRVHSGQGDTTKAERTLDEFLSSQNPDTLPPETVLELAKTQFALGHSHEAEKQLKALAQRCPDQPDVLEAIEKLFDEPVNVKDKLKARKLNKEGIKAFEEGDKARAIDAFRKALKLVPHHPSLNLNLIQVLLTSISDTDEKETCLRECQRSLNALEQLPEQHRQYKRYQTLSRKVEEKSHA